MPLKAAKKKVRFDPFHCVTAYRLARNGARDEEIAAGIGVAAWSLTKWRKAYPALDQAIHEGRNETGCSAFLDYARAHLSPEVQEAWDRIMEMTHIPNGVRRVEAILADKGEKFKQHLLVHALIATNFDIGHACRMIRLSRTEYHRWLTTDPDFPKVVDEINWHKGNFFEGAFCGLVAKGVPSVVIHANKTYNRDRGYGDVVQGQFSHEHKHLVEINNLGLPLEVRRQILEAVRNKQLPPREVQGEVTGSGPYDDDED